MPGITNDQDPDRVVLHGGEQDVPSSYADDNTFEMDQFLVSTRQGQVEIERGTRDDNQTPDEPTDDRVEFLMRVVAISMQPLWRVIYALRLKLRCIAS